MVFFLMVNPQSFFTLLILDRLSKNREEEEEKWATLGVHPLSWLLTNNRLEKVPFVSVPHTSSNRLLLSNQDKGCTPCVTHSLALPLGPALLNLWNMTSMDEWIRLYHVKSVRVADIQGCNSLNKFTNSECLPQCSESFTQSQEVFHNFLSRLPQFNQVKYHLQKSPNLHDFRYFDILPIACTH